MKNDPREYLSRNIHTLKAALKELEQDSDFAYKFKEACDIVLNSIKNGGKLLVIGNGGSAADAQHIAAELVVRYKKDGGIPAIALTTDTSVLTAAGNDYNYDKIFTKQLKALANPNKDVVIALTTSGLSSNILRALRYCDENDIKTIILTGQKENGNALDKFLGLVLKVPSEQTSTIQELHKVVYHSLCEIIEEKI